MEIAQLKQVSNRCPAGTVEFYHSFGSRFACLPVENAGLQGTLGGVSKTTLVMIGLLFGGLAWLQTKRR